MSTTVAVVGVGRMGANIARRLKDVDYTVAAVYDVDRGRAEALAQELGSEAPPTLAAVAAASDVIVTVVSDDAAMRSIYQTSGDSLLATGKIYVNCATITPAVHVDIHALTKARGSASIEACMASSIPQARDGSLYLICAGDEAAFLTVRPMLEKLSKALKYVGGPGSAAQVKALVNMLMNINTAGLAEALALGDALGLDLTLLREIFSQTGANSRVLETDGSDMQARDHEAYFMAAHAAKDSGIALAIAHDEGLTLPLAQATYDQYELMVTKGLGELDKSGVSELTFKDRRTA